MKLKFLKLLFWGSLIIFAGCESSDSVTSPSNTSPIADAGTDQEISTGALVTLDGSGSSDADGDALTYSWTLTTVPGGSSTILSDATASNPTFTTDVSGTYEASLIVNDGTVDSVADTVTITATFYMTGSGSYTVVIMEAEPFPNITSN